MTRRALVAAVGLLLLLGAACGRSADAPGVVLDGSARFPDDQGVATSITLEKVTLDGERAYPLARSLKAFSTYTLKLEPVLGRQGHYVHLGVRDGKVEWLAGIAAVVPGSPPSVYYTGTLVRRVKGQLVFEDGTVLRGSSGVANLAPGKVTVRIDPATGRVTEVVGG